MNRRVFVLSALALSGCATAAPPHVKAGPVLSELEPLYRATAGKEALIVSVSSNGCTAKGDFTFHMERRDNTVSVAFARKRIDTCKAIAMGKTDLSFTWSELGVLPRSQVFLLNPVTAWTGPGS